MSNISNNFSHITVQHELLERNINFNFNSNRCKNAGLEEIPNAGDYELIKIRRVYHFNKETDDHIVFTLNQPYFLLIDKGTDLNDLKNAYCMSNSCNSNSFIAEKEISVKNKLLNNKTDSDLSSLVQEKNEVIIECFPKCNKIPPNMANRYNKSEKELNFFCNNIDNKIADNDNVCEENRLSSNSLSGSSKVVANDAFSCLNDLCKCNSSQDESKKDMCICYKINDENEGNINEVIIDDTCHEEKIVIPNNNENDYISENLTQMDSFTIGKSENCDDLVGEHAYSIKCTETQPTSVLDNVRVCTETFDLKVPQLKKENTVIKLESLDNNYASKEQSNNEEIKTYLKSSFDIFQENMSINVDFSNQEEIEKILDSPKCSTQINVDDIKKEPDFNQDIFVSAQEDIKEFNCFLKLTPQEETSSMIVNLSEDGSDEPPLKQLKIFDFDFRGFTKEEQQTETSLDMFNIRIKSLDEEIENINHFKASPEKSKLYKCSRCAFQVKILSHLQMHLRSHVQPFWCNLCLHTSSSAQELLFHVQYSHADIGEKSSKFHKRVKSCNSDTKEKRFNNKDVIVQDVYKCGFCNYGSSVLSSLKTHIKTHAKEKLYYCDQCKYMTLKKKLMGNHMDKHESHEFECTECGYISLYRGDLDLHMQIHNKGKKYKCGQCSFRTSHLGYFNAHSSFHQIKTEADAGQKTRKLFKCDKCDYTTKQKSLLHRHKKKVHEPKLKSMSLYNKCGFWTESEEAYKEHSVHHDNVKPYKCDLCDFVTNNECNLKIHNKEHLKQEFFR